MNSGESNLLLRTVLVDRSSHLERARLGDDVDLAGAGAAELGGVGAGLDLEFANRVGRQADHERVERWIGVDRAVEEVDVRIRPAAADRDRGVLARPPVQRIHVAHLRAVRGVRAGHEQRELEKLPAVERQLRRPDADRSLRQPSRRSRAATARSASPRTCCVRPPAFSTTSVRTR